MLIMGINLNEMDPRVSLILYLICGDGYFYFKKTQLKHILHIKKNTKCNKGNIIKQEIHLKTKIENGQIAIINKLFHMWHLINFNG